MDSIFIVRERKDLRSRNSRAFKNHFRGKLKEFVWELSHFSGKYCLTAQDSKESAFKDALATLEPGVAIQKYWGDCSIKIERPEKVMSFIKEHKLRVSLDEFNRQIRNEFLRVENYLETYKGLKTFCIEDKAHTPIERPVLTTGDRNWSFEIRFPVGKSSISERNAQAIRYILGNLEKVVWTARLSDDGTIDSLRIKREECPAFFIGLRLLFADQFPNPVFRKGISLASYPDFAAIGFSDISTAIEFFKKYRFRVHIPYRTGIGSDIEKVGQWHELYRNIRKTQKKYRKAA